MRQRERHEHFTRFFTRTSWPFNSSLPHILRTATQSHIMLIYSWLCRFPVYVDLFIPYAVDTSVFDVLFSGLKFFFFRIIVNHAYDFIFRYLYNPRSDQRFRRNTRLKKFQWSLTILLKRLLYYEFYNIAGKSNLPTQ